MDRIILVVETGSDITPELAAKYGIHVVPMHVKLGEKIYADGTFPVQKIVDYYYMTGRLPKTSGSTVEDFSKTFDDIHQKWSEADIVYLAYSAETSDSYQNAHLAASNRKYVHIIDTKQVCIGQLALIIEVAKYIRDNPHVLVYDVEKYVESLSQVTKMCFVPNNLDFLRAGGKVGKRILWWARLRGVHPCIEVLNGKLQATRNYYGKMSKVATQLIKDYADRYKLKKDKLWLVYTIGLPEEIRNDIENAAWGCGFDKVQWIQAKAVITTHGGPAAFGLAGFSED